MNGIPEIDAETVERARAGDREAHARLYAAFAPGVYTLARRMLACEALAEDVLQETFVEVIDKLHTYRGDAALFFWVRRIAANKCLMQLRSGWVRRRVDWGWFESVQAGARGEAPDRHFTLEHALDRLTDTARAVLWLHDVEGYTHKEIGRLMGRTTSFSKSQLARAHERLRELMQEETRPGEGLCATALKTC